MPRAVGHHVRPSLLLPSDAVDDSFGRESTTDTQREGHKSKIIKIVWTLFVDDDETVRMAAVRAFDTLQEHIKARAIDQMIRTLLEVLRPSGESSGTALQALLGSYR